MSDFAIQAQQVGKLFGRGGPIPVEALRGISMSVNPCRFMFIGWTP